MRCIICNNRSLDLRYFYNQTLRTYELEYHCTTLSGGCDFYRVIPLDLQHEELLSLVNNTGDDHKTLDKFQ